MENELEVGGEAPRKQFPIHPQGPVPAIVADVFNLGTRVKDWQGVKSLKPMVAVVFQTSELREDGKPFELAREFVKSFSEKANLFKFVGQFLGKKLTPFEKFDLGKLRGQPCNVTVIHETGKDGKVRAQVGSPMPLMKGQIAPTLTAYTRAPYWAERMARYALESEQFERTSQDPTEPLGDAWEEVAE